MKRLFETADLEAELFEEYDGSVEEKQPQEYELTEFSEDSLAGLEMLSEEELDGFPALELTLELTDGRVLEYELASVFVHEEKEYVSLHPKTDTDGAFHIMRLIQGEDDEITLHQIEDEEELKAVYEVFFRLYADDADFEE